MRTSPLQVVVEAVDDGAAILAAELYGVASCDPGEVVEDLKGLTGAAARNAEGGGSEVIESAAEVDFWQAQLARAEIQVRR